MLTLNDDQKRIVTDQDRKAKSEFLNAMPAINNAGVKLHPKFKSYVSALGGH